MLPEPLRNPCKAKKGPISDSQRYLCHGSSAYTQFLQVIVNIRSENTLVENIITPRSAHLALVIQDSHTAFPAAPAVVAVAVATLGVAVAVAPAAAPPSPPRSFLPIFLHLLIQDPSPDDPAPSALVSPVAAAPCLLAFAPAPVAGPTAAAGAVGASADRGRA